MRHPPAGAGLALAAAKALVLVVVIALGFGLVGGEASGEDPGAARLDRVALPQAGPAVAQALRRHDCSVVGFDATVEPRSALVRRQGRLRHVSFDDGWAVFTGERPGELVALCLDDY